MALDPKEYLRIAREADKAGDTASAGQAMARYYALTEPTQPAQDLSGQPPANTGMGSTGGGAAIGPDRRGGMARRDPNAPVEEGSVPMTEWMGNAGRAALNVPGAAYRGVKQLFTDVPEEDIKADREIANKPGGTAGNVLGNIAMGGPLQAGARAGILAGAKYLPQALQAIPKVVASYPALAAGEAALTNATVGDESRLKNAAQAALVTGGLQLAGAAGRRAITQPIKPTEDTAAFLEKYIAPTMGTGGEGKAGALARGIENVLSYLPLSIGGTVKAGRERPMKEWLQESGERVAPQHAIDIPYGRGAFPKEIRKQFDDSYDTILSNKTIAVPPGWFTTTVNKAKDELLGTPEEAKYINALTTKLGGLLPQAGHTMPGTDWKKLQAVVREIQRDYAGEITDRTQHKAMASAFRAVDDQLNALRNIHLSKPEVESLTNVDHKYRSWTILDDALAMPSESGSPKEAVKNLIKSVEANTPQRMKNELGGDFQDLTEPAKRMFVKELDPGVLARRSGYMSTAALLGGAGGIWNAGFLPTAAAGTGLWAAGKGAAKLMTSRGPSRLAFGDMDWQKSLAKRLRIVGELGDPAAAAIGGSTGERNEP